MDFINHTVQRIADAMETGKLVSYQKNPNHKRANYIVLTQKGNKIYSKLNAKQIPWANDNARTIGTTELKTTLSVLRTTTSRFEPQ